MKKIYFPLFVLGIFIACLPAFSQTGFGKPEKFNDGWKFSLSDNPDYALPEYADSTWRRLNLPHDWSIEAPLAPTHASCQGFLPGGIGWYRKHFNISDTTLKRHIYFEGVYNRSDVYLNGHLLGSRPNGYASFVYDMTPYLREGDNVLSVRVDHSREADSRWYTGSGIYRDTWLVTSGDIHFDLWGVGYKALDITKKRAVVEVDASIVNPGKGLTLNLTVTDAAGKKVASAKQAVRGDKSTVRLNIPNPQLWDIDRPYLYNLRAELSENGKTIDVSELPLGLRTLSFNADSGFSLNGKNLKVKGVCLHHDAGALGAVVPPRVWERRLANLKDLGVNAIRMSHNPQAPALYDLCDRMGFLVMDEASDEWEFPKRKWIEGWNKGTPGFEGTYDFFEEWIDRDVADMVRRDRHHPSVFLWSIGNEVDYPNDPYSHPVLDGSEISQPMYGGYDPSAPDAARIGKIAKRLSAVVRGIDDSRPVTGALAGVVMSNETEYPQAVDVVGYNYTEKRYDLDHELYPDRVIYGSETGAGYDAWKAVRDRDHIFGQFIWTGIDYLGESGAWPSRGLHTGLLDFTGHPKPRGMFRKSLWAAEPMVYIGTYISNPRRPYLSTDAPDVWNYEDGQNIRVVCYTNQPQARLLLNGNIVGEVKDYDDATGIISWDIPYQPGTLQAQAIGKDGEVTATYDIVTSGRPYALRISADTDSLDDSTSPAHVIVEVVDEDGNLVKLADNEITLRVDGDARLLALDSGNNADMGDYTDNRQRVYEGRLIAYVAKGKDINRRQRGFPGFQPERMGNNPDSGKIRITATSPLLKKAMLEL